MNKLFYSLGLISGTSGDGVDASIISSNGVNKLELVLNKYFEYDEEIYESIHKLRENINSSEDFHNLQKEIDIIYQYLTRVGKLNGHLEPHPNGWQNAFPIKQSKTSSQNSSLG